MNEFENGLVEKFGTDVGSFLVNALRWFVFSDCADVQGVHGVRVADISDVDQLRAFEDSRGQNVREHQVWHGGKCFWLGLNHS